MTPKLVLWPPRMHEVRRAQSRALQSEYWWGCGDGRWRGWGIKDRGCRFQISIARGTGTYLALPGAVVKYCRPIYSSIRYCILGG